MPSIVDGFQPEGGTTEPLADDFAQSALGIGLTELRMSSVNQVGLTGAFSFSTRVLGSDAVALTRLSGKCLGVYPAQFAGDTLMAALITSMVNSRSLAVSGLPFDHL